MPTEYLVERSRPDNNYVTEIMWVEEKQLDKLTKEGWKCRKSRNVSPNTFFRSKIEVWLRRIGL